MDRNIVARAATKCALINLRDDFTADYYGIRKATISPCPTIAYLQEFLPSRRSEPTEVLYASHEQLVSDDEKQAIRHELERSVGRVTFTDNIQRRLQGLNDILRFAYGRSRLVVTTRLHGAIIAYGLRIPYIALPRDEKIRAFHRLYGNGVSIENVARLPEALATPIPCDKPVQYEQVHEFGRQVRGWLASVPLADIASGE